MLLMTRRICSAPAMILTSLPRAAA